MGPMGALHGRHESEIHPSMLVMGDISHAIQACLGLWLVLLGPIASPNSPNGSRLRLPTRPYPLPPAYPPL